jgi:hypothetical protein
MNMGKTIPQTGVPVNVQKPAILLSVLAGCA